MNDILNQLLNQLGFLSVEQSAQQSDSRATDLLSKLFRR